MPDPTGPYADRSKDGWAKITGLAQTLCRANSEFGPILRSKWTGSVPVLALLTALDALCPLIQPAKDDTFTTYEGGTNTTIDNDGEQAYYGRNSDAVDPLL